MGKTLAINGGKPVRTKPVPPWPYFWEDEKKAVQEVLDSGRVNYAIGGVKGKEFEKKFADYVGTKHAVVVSNGTAALHVALAAAGINPGDEVIVPSRTFLATASSVLHQNAVPIFADVDIKTGNILVESIKSLITERTKAIIPVHLAGHPAEMDEIMEIAKDHGLVVIEDAAQAHGAEYKGKKTGSIGHIAAFSFCRDKIMTTGGEGGMVTTNDDHMIKIARSIMNHGSGERGFQMLGYNYRITEMQSAQGIVTLTKLDKFVEKRRENAHYLTEKLKNLEFIETPYEAPYVKHSFYCYYILLNLDKLKVDKDTFIKAVRAEGVLISEGTISENYLAEFFQKKIGYGNTHCPFEKPWYSGDVDYTKVSCANAKELGKRAVRLEVYPTIDQEYLDDVITAIQKVGEYYCK